MWVDDAKNFLFAVYGGLVGAIISYYVALNENPFTLIVLFLVLFYGGCLLLIIWVLNIIKNKIQRKNEKTSRKN
jgi:F0F1-type ATP synthase assembly protein I